MERGELKRKENEGASGVDGHGGGGDVTRTLELEWRSGRARTSSSMAEREEGTDSTLSGESVCPSVCP